MNNIKIDLHTHSILSPDGGLSEREYEVLLDDKILDYVAITDHNQIAFAQKMQQKLGDRIIVGEEIMTADGEMLGLFLSEYIEPGLSAKETARLIHQQHGIVVIPHPFETMRKGIKESVLRQIITEVDGIEVCNGRSLQPATRKKAWDFVHEFGLAAISSSDAHCRLGICKTYTKIADKPNAKNMKHLLQEGELEEVSSPFISYLCPKFNRIRKMIMSL